MTTRSGPELLLEKHLNELGLAFKREYAFAAPLRKWRFDFVVGAAGLMLPDDRDKCVAIEIEGGHWIKGSRSHGGGKGFQKDLDKYNQATAMGWKVYRFSSKDVLTGRARDFLKLHLLEKGETR